MRLSLSALILMLPSISFAVGLIPGPGEPNHDAALHAKAMQYDRQFHQFNAAPFGLSLDANVNNASDRDLLTAYFAQTGINDFAQFATAQGTPRTVEEIINSRGEHGDLGMFGGVPAAGEAFRYMVLRDGGAPAAEVDQARQDLLDAIDAFHVYITITGEPGTIARGIRKTSEVGDPPEPFFASCPNPWERPDNVWRNDESGTLPDFYFMDNTSKDQMLGFVYALGAFWDAVALDPTLDQSVRDRLRADALALGTSLMQPVEVRSGTSIDLVIRGARGCITRHHELNPREVPISGAPPLVLSETSSNRVGFNALASLGIIRTLYHISGDETLRNYYYNELVAARDYPGVVVSGAARLRNMYANACVAGNCVVTNFSNVNMAFVAIYGVLRYETDPQLRAAYQDILENELWTGPRPHMGQEVQQAFFNLLYVSFRSGGFDVTTANNAATQLGQFPEPPYYNPYVENCDAAELAAGSCIGIDGSTVITIDSVPARGGAEAAEAPLPKSIRAPNNFEWRSDPRQVNGGGGNRLNPGGDFRGSYWLGRYMQRTGNNVSPIARNPDGSGGPSNDAGVVDSGVIDSGSAPDATATSQDASAPDAPSIDATVADSGSGKDAQPTIDSGSAVDAGSHPVEADDESCSCRGSHPAPVSLLRAFLRLRS